MDMLKEEMDKAGFKAVDSGSYFVKPFTHFQMQQCLDQKIFDDRVLLGLENLVKYMPEYGAGIYVDVRKS